MYTVSDRGKQYERPLVAKFAFFTDKIMFDKRLAGRKVGMNDQSLKKIVDRLKVLYPLFKVKRFKGKRVALVVDKLYIDNQLFRDTKTTPCLF